MHQMRPVCPLQAGEDAGLLLDYCARKLDPARAAALEAHMEHCAACRQFRDAQRLVWDSLDSWDLSGSGWAFQRRLRERLEEEEAAPAWIGRLQAWRSGISWKPAIPIAAALVLWLAIFPESPFKTPATAQAPQGEQLERVLEDVEMLRQLPLEAR